MEENKYYVPEISEFHVGFRFQVKDLDDDLVNTVWRDDEVLDWSSFVVFHDYIKKGDIRVPYLTKEDIEAEGWDFDNNMGEEPGDGDIGFVLEPCKPFEPTPSPYIQYVLMYNTKTHFAVIERIVDCGSGREDMLFRGKIKNRSEFRRILKMIRV